MYFDQTTNFLGILMQDTLGRGKGFIVLLQQGTPNIVWSNCKQVFFSKKMVYVDWTCLLKNV